MTLQTTAEHRDSKNDSLVVVGGLDEEQWLEAGLIHSNCGNTHECVGRPEQLQALTAMADDRYLVFFDIDNTLYSASSQISKAMGERIHAYFVNLGFPADEAKALHLQYYTKYGLALRGLTRHHDVGEAPPDYGVSYCV